MPWGQRVISVCTKTPITEKMRFILIKNWMWKRRAEKSDPREVGIVAFFLRTTMTSKATPLHCVSHVSFLLSEYKSIIPHWWQFISAFDVYYTVLQVNVLKARYTDRNTAQKKAIMAMFDIMRKIRLSIWYLVTLTLNNPYSWEATLRFNKMIEIASILTKNHFN